MCIIILEVKAEFQLNLTFANFNSDDFTKWTEWKVNLSLNRSVQLVIEGYWGSMKVIEGHWGLLKSIATGSLRFTVDFLWALSAITHINRCSVICYSHILGISRTWNGDGARTVAGTGRQTILFWPSKGGRISNRWRRRVNMRNNSCRAIPSPRQERRPDKQPSSRE